MKISKLEHEAQIKKQIEWFESLTEAERLAVDTDAQHLRNAFGESANWTVWGEPMVSWDELPEANRVNWRRVLGASHPTALRGASATSKRT